MAKYDPSNLVEQYALEIRDFLEGDKAGKYGAEPPEYAEKLMSDMIDKSFGKDNLDSLKTADFVGTINQQSDIAQQNRAELIQHVEDIRAYNHEIEQTMVQTGQSEYETRQSVQLEDIEEIKQFQAQIEHVRQETGLNELQARALVESPNYDHTNPDQLQETAFILIDHQSSGYTIEEARELALEDALEGPELSEIIELDNIDDYYLNAG